MLGQGFTNLKARGPGIIRSSTTYSRSDAEHDRVCTIFFRETIFRPKETEHCSPSQSDLVP